MSKANINVTVSDTDIRSIMNKLFSKEPLKDSYVELFTNVMVNNHRLFNQFFSIYMGTKFKLPEVGDYGYVSLESLKYESYYEKYKSSEFNKQGNIPCIVFQINGIADWSNLTVKLPTIEGEEVASNIRLGDFTLANEDLEIENSIFC
jgi:hypothetical protein